jgi:DNA polymerase-1
MLLDANSLIYRAYFALSNTPLTTSKGQLVNAVFGFWSIVLRGFTDVRPDYVVAAFDLAGPTFRHDQFAEYKATRREMPGDLRDQFPKVRELIEAFNVPIYQLQGFEADDLLATLVRQAEERGLNNTIVSGDLDMLQVVTDRTQLMTTRGGVQMTVVYDPARINERYGLTAAQMIDYKALKGDTTDNIPGIPGVGEKTAGKLLQDHGTLEGVYANLDKIAEKLRVKLVDHRDQVFLSRSLVTLERDLPVELDLDPARLGNYDRDEVIRLFREYEFRTLVERLPSVAGEAPLAPGELLRQADRSAPVPAARVPGQSPGTARAGGVPPGEGSGLQLTLELAASAGTGGAGELGPGVESAAGRRSPIGSAPAGESAVQEPVLGNGRAPTVAPGVASPLEVLPTDPRAGLTAALRDPDLIEHLQPGDDPSRWLAAQSELRVGLAMDDPRPRRGTVLGVAAVGDDGRVLAADPQTSPRLLQAIMAAGRPISGHDTKRLLVAELDRRDPRDTQSPAETVHTLPRVSFDTQIAAYIMNAALRSQSLADISAERLGIELPPAGALGGRDHAAIEALAAEAARESLAPAMGDERLARLYREVELPLIPVLAGMEATGIAIDREALETLRRTFAESIARLEQEIYESVGHQFNLGSPKQLEQVLFYELNLPRGRRTKTGYSTDAAVLEELRPAHPMIGMMLDWRIYTKLKSTYVDALPGLLDPDTGRLHTTFHQAVATTGRLSSSDPNLQNIPIRTDLGRQIRRAFVAGDPSRTLLAADYSQIELRILAHVSGDVHLREAFERRADIHRETAALVLHKDPADITPDERSMAKMVNFGIAYGMSDFGLSSRANIPRAEAQAFINSYFATYSGISYYMLHIKDTARRDGFVATLLGRRRWIPELEARNPTLRAAGERMAINMPIQGTAADIVKIAMIRLEERLRSEGFAARLLLQVHDELLLEVPRDEVARLAPVVREVMENALPLEVPLVVDVKTGDNWEALTPIPDPTVPEPGDTRLAPAIVRS